MTTEISRGYDRADRTLLTYRNWFNDDITRREFDHDGEESALITLLADLQGLADERGHDFGWLTRTAGELFTARASNE